MDMSNGTTRRRSSRGMSYNLAVIPVPGVRSKTAITISSCSTISDISSSINSSDTSTINGPTAGEGATLSPPTEDLSENPSSPWVPKSHSRSFWLDTTAAIVHRLALSVPLSLSHSPGPSSSHTPHTSTHLASYSWLLTHTLKFA